jgi:hypothetical protein
MLLSGLCGFSTRSIELLIRRSTSYELNDLLE